MIYTKYDDQDELMQMREQLQLLKNKLSREHILNEKVMRRVVKEKISSVQRRVRAMTIIGACATPFVLFTLTNIGFSMSYIVVTGVFLLMAILVENYQMNIIRSQEAMSGNLLSTGVKILRVKRLQQQWLIVGLVFVAVWLTWGGYELRAIFPNPEDYRMMVISGMVGGVIGGIIGGSIYFRNQRELSEIIEQIKELTEEENI